MILLQTISIHEFLTLISLLVFTVIMRRASRQRPDDRVLRRVAFFFVGISLHSVGTTALPLIRIYGDTPSNLATWAVFQHFSLVLLNIAVTWIYIDLLGGPAKLWLRKKLQEMLHE